MPAFESRHDAACERPVGRYQCSGFVRSFDGLAQTHAQITAPVTLIWGVDDPWFPLEHARKMLGQFRGGAELHELPGKLFVHEERPAEWAAITRRALDAISASGAARTVRLRS